MLQGGGMEEALGGLVQDKHELGEDMHGGRRPSTGNT